MRYNRVHWLHTDAFDHIAHCLNWKCAELVVVREPRLWPSEVRTP